MSLNQESDNLKNPPSQRTAILAAAASFISIFTVVALLLFTRYQLAINLAESELRNIAQIYDDNLQLLISNFESIMRVVETQVQAGIEEDHLHEFLETTVANLPQLRTLRVLDADGTVIADARPIENTIGVNLSDRQYFQAHTDSNSNDVYIDNPLQSRLDDVWTVPISLAVRNERGELLGVVVTAIEPSHLSSMSFGRFTNMTGFVVNNGDVILATIPYDESRIGTQFTEYEHHLANSNTSTDTTAVSSATVVQADGQLIVRQDLGSYDIGLFFAEDTSVILSQFYSEALTIVIASVILLLVIIYTVRQQYVQAVESYEQALQIQSEATQRQLAEIQITQERNLLRTIIDNIPDYIFVKDQRGRFIESNPSHSAAAGLSQEQILNRTAIELFDTSIAVQFQKDDRRVLKDGEVLVNEERITTASDGSQRWVLTTKLPLYDENKQEIIGLVGISRDITDRREAEQELRESEQRLRTIVSNLPAIIFEMNTDGSILMMEGEPLSSIGLSASEIQQRSIIDIFGHYVDDMQNILKIAASGREHNHLLPIDEKIFDTYYIPRYDDSGNIISVIGIANEITPIIEAERIRLEMQQERDLLELKERFIATASHDFRTPLSVIQSNVGMLLRYDDKYTAETRLARLNKIQWQIEHMTNLMDYILTLSKLNAGRIEPNLQIVELQLFCERVWSDMNDREDSHDNTHFDYQANTEQVSIDEHLIQYAIINLLSNAFKYTPDDKSVTFRVTDDDTSVHFCVIDEGIGIPQDEIKNLFEPFFRASNAESYEGKGLGLAIVKHYVELHQGTIQAHSEEGKGTTFTVTIPIQSTT